MKTLLVYSSKTENTKKIADVINEKLQPNKFCDVTEITSEDAKKYDFIVVGGWIDKGVFNKEVMDFISDLENKKIAFFFTLGAYPTSMHAYDCINSIKAAFIENNNQVIAHYHCQGAIDPKLIEWMKNLPSDHGHSVDENRLNRWNDAMNHPNQEDFNAAKNFVTVALKKLGEMDV